MMTLDAAGNFMLTIIGPGLPRFASNNRTGGTPEENQAVMSKSIAMIGTYSHSQADKTLTFKVESSTFPNWNGTQQKRIIVALSKDELKYITPTASSGGVGTSLGVAPTDANTTRLSVIGPKRTCSAK